jgi:hypothetical protein
MPCRLGILEFVINRKSNLLVKEADYEMISLSLWNIEHVIFTTYGISLLLMELTSSSWSSKSAASRSHELQI